MSQERLAKIRALVQQKMAAKEMRPQFWKPAGLIARISPLRKIQHWLKTPASLTAELKQRCPHLEVVVLSQKFEVPLLSETQKLGLAINEEAWVRCVVLKCQQRNWVYARTVIPNLNSQNPWQELQTLGNKPLGEILFEIPSIQRSPFEFAKEALSDWPYLMNHLQQPQLSKKPGFARRSVFKQKQSPLLLTEVFLPGLLDLPNEKS